MNIVILVVIGLTILIILGIASYFLFFKKTTDASSNVINWPEYISLTTNEDKYCIDISGSQIQCNSDTSQNTKFKVDLSNNLITLRGSAMNRLCTNRPAGIICNRNITNTNASNNERFKYKIIDEDSINLISSNDKYCKVITNKIICNSDDAGDIFRWKAETQ